MKHIVLTWYQYKWAKTDEESQGLSTKNTHEHEKVSKIIIAIIIYCKNLLGISTNLFLALTY